MYKLLIFFLLFIGCANGGQIDSDFENINVPTPIPTPEPEIDPEPEPNFLKAKNDQDLDSLIKNEKRQVFLVFEKDGCTYCDKFKPTAKKFADKFKNKVVVILVHKDLCPKTRSKYSIRVYPTTVTETGQLIGQRPIEELERLMRT